MSYDYDLLVVGSGPAGQKAAIQSAKVGRRVAIVERQQMVGGVCINSGTIPSKTLREAVMYLTGMSQRSMYGESYRVKDDLTIEDLFWRTHAVIGRETDVVRHQLSRNHVHILTGTARFLDPHTIAVTADGMERRCTADRIVIAVGTRPARPASVDFDERTIIDSDGILHLEHIPNALLVVGAGVIGIEYASMFAALGSKVTIVEQRQRLLEFCDAQVTEALQYHLRELGVMFRFGDEVVAVDQHDTGTITRLRSGKRIAADTVLYSAGRQGATDELDLGKAGLEASGRGRIEVDEHYRTAVEHIYAVGDVIGFPSLAATAMEQGRLAASHACGIDTRPISRLLPIGIYTIPEISFVGRTEEELTDDQTPYEVGVSRYRELARGAILGDTYGILKLLVSADDRRILGVHAFGTTATELVHIGQTVMAFDGTVDYLVEAVFNYPTLAESYKVAALDATNKLRTISTLSASAPA
ncbi:MAG TPA: Si-specific NAD(P)(+) transhydrogenase [Gaiellales bacterium]|jgi:NAD(P) transhydrogenase|nr:Si-specific NAD(P)(+) transhydrogenase [Gaiellales bacterium]